MSGAPNWLVDTVVDLLQDLVASLDEIAAGNTLNPAAAAAFKVAVATATAPSVATPAPTASVVGIGNALAALYNAVPLAVSNFTGIDPSIMPGIAAVALAIGAAMDPATAVDVFAGAADDVADPGPAPTSSRNRIIDTANAAVVARAARLVLLAPYGRALVSRSYASRQEGITARADCVERIARDLQLCQGAPDAPVAAALYRLRDTVVDWLSTQITNLKPVVTVSANVPLPSLWWAWRLYGDPTRAAELVARNNVPHPSFMPIRFEALAPNR